MGPFQKGSIYLYNCCINGHHNECMKHVKSPEDRKEHRFIVLSNGEYNKESDSILVVSISSKRHMEKFNCLYPLDPQDVKEWRMTKQSFVRCDCVCRLNKASIHLKPKYEGSVTKDALGQILVTVNKFMSSTY